MIVEDFISELKVSINNGPEYFRSFIQGKFLEGISSKHFDELISHLEDLPETEPELSLELSEILLDVVPVDDYTDPSYRGMTWYFRILSLLYKPDPEVLLKNIAQALDYLESAPVNTIYGFMICHNAKIKISPDVLGEDNLLLFYKRCADYFKNIGEYKEALKFMLSAASIFSKHGAYQSAERLLHDAEELSGQHDQIEMQAGVGYAIAQSAIDQHDHVRAENIFETLFECLGEAGVAVPDLQVFNLAMVKMRLDKTAEAMSMFAEIKERAEPESYLLFTTSFHLAICQKDLGDLVGAEESFVSISDTAGKIVLDLSENFDSELNDLLIEHDLVKALVLATNGKFAVAERDLIKAFERIELGLDLTVRPHYRKRIRSQYNNRILEVVELIWRHSNAEALLPILIGLKKNTQSDWLSILEWIDYVQSMPEIDPADKNKLDDILTRLQRHSGMIIGPYQEKYDDPFEWASKTDSLLSDSGDYTSNLPWQDFALFSVEVIHRYGLKPVYHFSRIDLLSTRLQKKVLEKQVLLFVFLTPSGYTSYIFSDKSIFRESLEFYHFKRYDKDLWDYRGNKIDWTDFARSFNGVVDFIDEQLTVIWNLLQLNTRTGLCIFSGVFDSYFPLPQACLANKVILERLGKGDFTVAQCPVMFPQKQVERNIERADILVNTHHQLALFEPEANTVVARFTNSNLRYVSNDSEVRTALEESIEADLVHIITHGIPISRFANPFYASLAGGTFSLGALKSLNSARSQLYFIGACNAADTANPSAGVIIPTNEIVGYITILMQNRTAKVIGSKWPILDRVGFVFANIFYVLLAETGDIHKAYGQTIYKMATEPRDFFLPFLEFISSMTAREKLNIELNSENKPFDLAFYYTSMNLYTLI